MSYEDNNPFGDTGDGDRRPSFARSPESNADASHPAPPPLSFPGMQRNASNGYSGTCRRPDQIPDYLDSGGEIAIVQAGMNNEGAGGPHIAYTIRTGDLQVRRRYSEFESLRQTLARLYPCIIVPPIPEKQSLTDYTQGTAKAREDAGLIDHRKRMLEVFLRRVAAHDDLRKEAVFVKFLDSNVSWSEVLSSPPVSLLPKNVLKAPPENPAAAHGDLSHSNLPIPAHTSKKSKTASDPTSERLLKVEETSKAFEGLLNSTLEKTNRRIMKRYGDLALDYNELGAQLNAFSLSEEQPAAGAVEKLGQACDETYLATNNLVHSLGNVFGEPLAEQGQILAIVRQVLKYRRQKMTQVEHAEELLQRKRDSLDQLERSEQEARRIDGALGRLQQSQPDPGQFPPTHDFAAPGASKQASTQTGGASADGSLPSSTNGSLSARKSSLTSGFMGRINHAIHSLTDTDPALARRQKIGSTRELIQSLEVASRNSGRDLKYIDEKVSDEVEKWEADRRRDWQLLMASVGACYVEWAKKCLESWQEAERAVD